MLAISRERRRYEAVRAPNDTFMIFDSEDGVPVVDCGRVLGGLSRRDADVVLEKLQTRDVRRRLN